MLAVVSKSALPGHVLPHRYLVPMLNPGLTGLGLGLGLMTFDALAQATVSDWGQQWRNQVGKWEEESNIPPGLALWTDRKDFQGIGLPRTERALALVDLTCAQKVKDTGCSLRLIREQALIRLMSDCVLDISQKSGPPQVFEGFQRPAL